MIINFNGELVTKDTIFTIENRGYKYGDALFETIKVVNSKILFLEDHYFRLMASMRILRIEIPMYFTMEFLSEEILKTIKSNDLAQSTVRVRLNVDRGNFGNYLPKTNTNINYAISAVKLQTPFYTINTSKTYVVDLFKDHFVSPSLLSTLKTNNKALQVIGCIYAKENDLDNCLVLNTNKHVIEALNGNIFLVNKDTIKTPPLSDGCLNGIMRKQILNVLKNNPNYNLEEASISAFELQKADELFITNTIKGILPITKYRKKRFGFNNKAQDIVSKLNAKIRLG